MRFFIATLLLSVSASAQQSFTLVEAQNYALANNPAAKIAEFEVQQAQHTVDEYRAIGLPQLNAEASFQNFIDIPTSLVPAQFFDPTAGPDDFVGVQFGTKFNTTGGITLSQLLFDGSYLTGLKAAKMYPVLSQKEQEKTSMEIKSSVEQAYFMVAIAEKSITILDSLYTSNVALMNYMQILEDKGMTNDMAYDQIDFNFRKLRSQQKKAELDLELAFKSLKMSMGMPLDAQISITEKMDDLVNRIIAASVSEDYAVDNHVDLQLLNTALELQQMNLTVKKNAFFPSLGAFFNHQQQSMKNDFTLFSGDQWFPISVWGLSLKVPIISGGQRKAQVKHQEIEVKKMEATIEQTKQGLSLQYEAAKLEYKSALEIYKGESESYAVAEKIKRLTDKKFKAKTGNIIEVTQAQLQVDQARVSYIQSMYALLNAKVKIDKITNNYE